jgi:DNA-binding response OmpR family regulator
MAPRRLPWLGEDVIYSSLVSETIGILVVDDEAEVRDMLFELLACEGFRVAAAGSAAEARQRMLEAPVELALLDVSMPGEDGFSLAQHFRRNYPVAIILVTAKDNVVDRVVGLEIGADDYVIKPFDPRELLARIRSVLRRTSAAAAAELGEGRIRFGRCVLDLKSHRLYGDDAEEVPLTSMEFDLLQAFARRPNRVLSRDQILTLTQSRDWQPCDRSVDIRIARLRKRIEHDPDKPQTLKTVRGIGYMFVTHPGK